jgi:DHA1 family tetracycline resistance protein-like MFS transporter
LPESLPRENRRAFNFKRANPIGAFLNLKKYPSLYGLLFALFLIYVASHAVESNWSYFTMYKFSWDEKMVGISLGVVGVLVSLVQGGLIRWTSKKLGNEKSIYVGMVLYTIGMFLFAFASESWMMFLFLIPYCLAGIAGPALRAIISNHVLPTEQGEIQGTIASLISAATIIGPPVMSSLFYYFTHKDAPFEFAGMPFILGGLLMICSGTVSYFSLKKYAASNTNND